MAVWDRNLMGFAASPYNSIKMALVAEEICKGDRFETGVGCDGKELNPFQWDVITLNLPGTKDYDPRYSWIVKRRKDGQTACDLFTFVDDERVVGPSEELTWQASHVLASKQSYLGIQDAARKARPCSQTAGCWASAIVHVVDQLGVCVFDLQRKMVKDAGDLGEVASGIVGSKPTTLPHAERSGLLGVRDQDLPSHGPLLEGLSPHH